MGIPRRRHHRLAHPPRFSCEYGACLWADPDRWVAENPAGTGAGWENHDILSWDFANTTELAPPPVSGVPEPGQGAMMLLAGALLAGLARVRRGA